MDALLHAGTAVEKVLSTAADWLWGDWLLIALLGLGVVYTTATGVIQVRKFPLMVSRIIHGWKQDQQENGAAAVKNTAARVSPVQALFMALGSCVGSGNIVGVSTALIAGGPGALFWMWAAAFLGMATKFGEIVLGICYRRKNEAGEYTGGPMYYIAAGLKAPALGALTAVLLFIQNTGGTLIQSNVIAKVIQHNFGIPTYAAGIILAVLMIVIIHGGLRRLVRVQQKLVPIMSCLYITGGLIVIFANIHAVPAMFASIFEQAFTAKAGIGGLGGLAMRYGVARGLYSNEAGEGSAAVLHSTAEVKHPVEQGLMGLAEVFVDTMIICSNTGFAVLASGVSLKGADASQLAAQAFAAVFEPMKYIVYISLLLFAFTSLMSQWFFGHVSLEYFHSVRGDRVYKVIFPIAILVGSISTIQAVWYLQDCALGLLIIPNIIAMVVLAPKVRALTKEYFKRGESHDK